MSSKVCPCCKTKKDISLFSKNKSRKDGVHPSCKDCKNKGNNLYHSKNRSKEAEYSKKYFQTVGKFQKAKLTEVSARRRARKLLATPKWLSANDLLAIKCKYSVAAMLNKHSNQAYAVDHVIPLQGKTVCGLHVPWNLQVITAKDNLKKGNKLQGDTDA
jgi:5-methylcytosine-specific restriction endonuclease McrA